MPLQSQTRRARTASGHASFDKNWLVLCNTILFDLASCYNFCVFASARMTACTAAPKVSAWENLAPSKLNQQFSVRTMINNPIVKNWISLHLGGRVPCAQIFFWTGQTMIRLTIQDQRSPCYPKTMPTIQKRFFKDPWRKLATITFLKEGRLGIRDPINFEATAKCHVRLHGYNERVTRNFRIPRRGVFVFA